MLIYAYSFFTCLLLFVVWGSHIINPSLHVGENLQRCNVIWSSGFVVVYTGSPGVKSCVSGVSFGATSSQTYSALTWAFWLNISWDLGFGESLKKLMPNWMCLKNSVLWCIIMLNYVELYAYSGSLLEVIQIQMFGLEWIEYGWLGMSKNWSRYEEVSVRITMGVMNITSHFRSFQGLNRSAQNHRP